MIPRVLIVMTSSIRPGSMLKVPLSTSTSTGFAPVSAMASPVAMKVKGVVMISSPGPTPWAMRAMISASVPEPTPMANSVPTKAASSPSRALPFSPRMKRWEEMTSAISLSISSR